MTSTMSPAVGCYYQLLGLTDNNFTILWRVEGLVDLGAAVMVFRLFNCLTLLFFWNPSHSPMQNVEIAEAGKHAGCVPFFLRNQCCQNTVGIA